MTTHKDEIPLSKCCGVEMPNWPDCDLCPECLEHTGVDGDEDDSFYTGVLSQTQAMKDHNSI